MTRLMNLIKGFILFSALFLSSVFAFAAIRKTNGYDLNMQLSMNGKLVATPRIITKAGETTTIIQKVAGQEVENFVEVTAIDGSILGNEGIMLTFVVGTIGKNGERIVLSKPQIFAKENQKAEAKFDQGDDKEALSLSVVAKRKAL